MKKRTFAVFASMLVCSISAFAFALKYAGEEDVTNFNDTIAATKNIGIYSTFSNRLKAVSGESYKQAVVNSYVTLRGLNVNDNEDKQYYAEFDDGGTLWKYGREKGDMTNAMDRVKIVYTPVDEGAYIEFLTSFNSQGDTGLTPQTADISYIFDDPACPDYVHIAGNYWTMVAHGALNLSSFYLYYGCDDAISITSEIISAEDVVVQVDSEATIAAESSFGNGITFSYQSLDTNVAIVDTNGVVTGLATGETTITITSSVGNEKVINVSVTQDQPVSVAATLIDDNSVYASSKNTVYKGIEKDSLEATRSNKTNNYRHVYLKFDASSILDAYENLPDYKKPIAKAHLKIYERNNLANYQASDVNKMHLLGVNPIALSTTTSDEDHGNCIMTNWDPNYVTMNNVSKANNVQGYSILARDGSYVSNIAFNNTSTLDVENKILDLYFNYDTLVNFIHSSNQVDYGYITFVFWFEQVSSHQGTNSFAIYTSKTPSKQPTLYLEA